MGMLITANHIEMVLVNLGDEIIKKERIRLKFTTELSYCTEAEKKVKTFLAGESAEKTLLGIGIAIPGIVDQKERIVLKSHAPVLKNYSLRFLEQAIGIPVYFENDANGAMLAEKTGEYSNVIYLSLNHTLGVHSASTESCFWGRTIFSCFVCECLNQSLYFGREPSVIF